jgi:CheY-like chemotaxis protein
LQTVSLETRPLRRILLVEDDPDIQSVVVLALESLGGFQVGVCGSAREALESAPAWGPDLILLDVMMPGCDGLATLSALRQIPSTAGVPVVFVTAKVQPHELERYREMGSLGVISKPFEPEALPETIRTLWSRLDA